MPVCKGRKMLSLWKVPAAEKKQQKTFGGVNINRNTEWSCNLVKLWRRQRKM